MTLELTIQDMFDCYPTLFKERADCLNQLFCTIGNGYEWKNGELCRAFSPDMERINHLASRLIDGKAHQYKKLSVRDEARLYEEKRIAEGWYGRYKEQYPDEDIEHLRQVREKTIAELPDDVFYHIPERAKRWYFYIPESPFVDFCEDFAYLFNYPDDIKPDWKAGIDECRRLLVEDGYDVPERNALSRPVNRNRRYL